MKNLIQKGFSMVELMVILAALGGVALIVTRLGKNSMDIQNETQSAADYADLVRNVHFLLGDSDSCKATFGGMIVKETEMGKEISGIEILSKEAGSDKTEKKYIQGKTGSLTIGKIALTISPAQNSSNRALHGTKALVTVAGIKSDKASKMFADIKHPVNLTLKKDPADGETKIESCERFDSDTMERARVWCGTVVASCLSGQRVMAIGKYHENKFTGVVHALDNGTPLNCPALIDQSAQLTECGN